jgi:general secretion pathway protein D
MASVLAQTDGFGKMSSGTRNRPSQYAGMGPGGMGGAAMADFDTLIDLITSTVHTNEWLENGGNGTIESFPTTLSLVISQTEEVHEDIADLLDQLRRLMDLQVTIEVRFITLNDDFFERIGIDFDFDIDDKSG